MSRPSVIKHLRSTFTRRHVMASALVAASAWLTPFAHAQSKLTPVNIGEGLSLGWAQFFVADAEQLWAKQGLQANAITFPSGRLVLDGVIGGRLQVGTAAETPVVFAALNGLPIRIIGTLNNGSGKPYEPFELIANTGIKQVADIKGKRIGYAQGTNAHYYLHKVLQSAGLKFSDIQAISLTPSDFATSLSNGALDGFVWTEPFVSQALTQGKGRVHKIATPVLYTTHSSIITLQSTIEQQPETLKKVLKTIIDADKAIAQNPQNAITKVSERVNFDPKLAQQYWPQLNLGLGLNKEQLVKELQEQAQWAIDQKLVAPNAKLPDFNQIVVDTLYQQVR